MNDIVSIITPVYNSEKYIADTASSVFSQTYSNWEWLIVDDCSSDQSLKIIESFDDPRVSIIKNSQNQGVVASRNKAIAAAQGRYLAFLDSDDMWFETKLEKQVLFMQENNYSFTFHSYYKVSEKGELGELVQARSEVNYNDMLNSNFIGCLTSMYDASQLGKFNMIPGYKAREDYICWLNILKKVGKAYAISEPLAKYRVISNSLSSKKIEMLKEQYRVYREVLKLNYVQANYHFLRYLAIGWNKYRK